MTGWEVNDIFKANLSNLCARYETKVEVSRLLNLHRGQLYRFLNGEAFPKPAVLKRICEHFGVDANILIERLPE